MSITGMNNLIEKTGTPRSVVFVDGVCLLAFPTNQQAWQYLNDLFKTSVEEETSWPEEVYVAFMMEEVGGMVLVPQIDKAVILDGQLKYKGLYGDAFFDFRKRIIDNWPSIKEGLSDA
jgi:hypothetical protein